MNRKRRINLITGPALFALSCLLIPMSFSDSLPSRAAIGTVLWVAYWWITGPVDLGVTSLLPIAINVFVNMAPMEKVIANYASDTIMLVLGASILGITMEETGLSKRVALRFLGAVGEKMRSQLLFWFMLSVLLSAVLPNTVVCAALTPIAVSILHTAGIDDIRSSKTASKLLLYIAYGVGVGGLMSPLGGAMNLVTVNYLEQVTGQEFMYYIWIVRFLPIIAVLLISNIVYMLRDVKKTEVFPLTRSFCMQEYRNLPKISKEEILTLILFLGASALAFSRPLYSSLLPELKPSYVFLISGILSFFIPGRDHEPVLKWKTAEKKIIWELLIIYAGGLALGTLLSASGAAEAISAIVSDAGLTGGIVTVFVIVSVTLVLSDVTSNTATAAVIMPIVISITEGLGMNPVPWIYIATIGVNLSYSLPTSIRAIPVGYGLNPGYMLKEGWKLSLIVIVLMTAVSFLLLRYWPAFSMV